MTDELKRKLRQLVADPPPPSGVPSEVLYERIRTVRRRRAAGTAAATAVAAVAVVAVAAGTLGGPKSAPPVTNTPHGPETIVTSPTIKPSETPPTSKSSSTGETATTPPTVDGSSTPPADPSSPTTKLSSPRTSSPTGPFELRFGFTPVTNGLTASMKIAAEGTVLRPLLEEGGTLDSAYFHDNLVYVEYWWGDNTHVVEDRWGGIGCYQYQGAPQKQVSGKATRQVGPHTYARPGEYRFTYRVTYCTPSGPVQFTRASGINVTATTSSP